MTADATQLSLSFTADSRIVLAPRTGTLDQRFEAWAKSNPAIVDAFELLALQAVRHGRKRIGAKAVVERIRWEYSIVSNDAASWKCNNDYTSRLARLVTDRNAELRGVFQTRALRNRKLVA